MLTKDDEGGRGGKPKGDEGWQGGGGLETPKIGWHNMWTAPNLLIWEVKECMSSQVRSLLLSL